MPLFWLSLTFLLGMLFASVLPFTWRVWAAAAGLVTIGLATYRLIFGLFPHFFTALQSNTLAQRWRLARQTASAFVRLPPGAQPRLPAAFLLIAALLGGWRFAATYPNLNPAHIARRINPDRRVVIEGIVARAPDERDEHVKLVVQAQYWRPRTDLIFAPVAGLLTVNVPAGEIDWRYGDRIRLEGYLDAPDDDEGFSYRAFLARQDIYAVLRSVRALRIGSGAGNPFWALVFSLNARALDLVYRMWPDPEASLLAGILLGNERGIPASVAAAFTSTGTQHVIAISGFNMAVLSGLFMSLFLRFLGRPRRFLAAGLCALVLGFYTLLVGANPAVTRAALMGALTVYGAQFARRQNGLNTLAFVAALMALANPHVLWDAGFQLSFMATLGLMLYAEPLQTWFFGFSAGRWGEANAERLTGPVSEYLLFTLAAQLTTLPVTVYHFGRVSLSSLLANPLILPAQPPIMILGGSALLLGFVSQPLGQLAGLAVWPFVAYSIRLVEALDGWRMGEFAVGQPSLAAVSVFYALLLGWTYVQANTAVPATDAENVNPDGPPALAAPGAFRPAWRIPVLAALGVLAVVVWRTALAAPDGRLHLWMLDVGDGEALLIRAPEGQYVLINGGASPAALSDPLGRLLPLAERPPFRTAALDWVVVAATEPKNIGALPRVLERFPPGQVLWAGPPSGSYEARALYRKLVQNELPVVSAQPGQSLDLGQGARLEVLAVGGRGAVLLLEWQAFQALLPVGLDFKTLETLIARTDWDSVDILLLADGGYPPLCPAEWIQRWRPQVALHSASADSPLASDLSGLLAGVTLVQTGPQGSAHVATDGSRLWVETDRP